MLPEMKAFFPLPHTHIGRLLTPVQLDQGPPKALLQI